MQPPNEQDPVHWEAIIRSIIEQIGPDGFVELVDYVVDEMVIEDETVVNFVVAHEAREH